MRHPNESRPAVWIGLIKPQLTLLQPAKNAELPPASTRLTRKKSPYPMRGVSVSGQNAQNVLTGRPDEAPNPSIRASAPSNAASRSWISRSQARFSSLGSVPKACTASLSSLCNVRDLRCKLTTVARSTYAATSWKFAGPSNTRLTSFASSANATSRLFTISRCS